MFVFARLAAVLGLCFVALTAANDVETTERLERGVLEEINYARQNPRDYAEELRRYRSYIQGDIVYLPGDPNGAFTREGTRSVDEAIDFLERQAPLPPLSPALVLALAARDHADEQGRLGDEGHLSRDGANPGERVRRRGGGIFVGESIAYGHADPAAVVRALIVDDGVPDRGHRRLLFGGDFRFAGIGCGAHRRLQHLCVIDLSGTEKGDPLVPGWAQARGAQVFTYRGPR